ncbi:MAG: DotU family type IV/VI secretion system protein [Coxiellaceae bacterium]|nr:MAG: DotU family type IV/VI secretion system protein [Coxiellaceae bacterium]
MTHQPLQTNLLLECCGPLLQIVCQLRQPEKLNKIPENLREQIYQSLTQMERQAIEFKVPLTQVEQAKYALLALLDELVLTSGWNRRMEWMGKTLQVEFFGEHLAGEGFFNRLSEVRHNAQANIDVLEVFYLCLQLGFEGKYRQRHLEQWLALQVDLRNQIELVRGSVDARLSPSGLPQLSVATKVGTKLPYWVLASVTAAVIFLIYLGYTVAIEHQANKTVAAIQRSHDQLLEQLSKATLIAPAAINVTSSEETTEPAEQGGNHD